MNQIDLSPETIKCINSLVVPIVLEKEVFMQQYVLNRSKICVGVLNGREAAEQAEVAFLRIKELCSFKEKAPVVVNVSEKFVGVVKAFEELKKGNKVILRRNDGFIRTYEFKDGLIYEFKDGLIYPVEIAARTGWSEDTFKTTWLNDLFEVVQR